MDAAAAAEAEGMTPPGIRLRTRQKKVTARRKRRQELVWIQIGLFGGLLLLVKGFSYFSDSSGEPDQHCLLPNLPLSTLSCVLVNIPLLMMIILNLSSAARSEAH